MEPTFCFCSCTSANYNLIHVDARDLSISLMIMVGVIVKGGPGFCLFLIAYSSGLTVVLWSKWLAFCALGKIIQHASKWHFVFPCSNLSFWHKSWDVVSTCVIILLIDSTQILIVKVYLFLIVVIPPGPKSL